MQKKSNFSIGLIGRGRMGKQICGIASERGLPLVSVDRASSPGEWKAMESADVWIEFALQEGFIDRLQLALKLGMPFVIGTTGLQDLMPTVAKLCEEKKGSILHANNFSIGMALFMHSCQGIYESCLKWETQLQAQIEEIHHTGKKDSPSGSALELRRRLQSVSHSPLSIQSERLESVPGIHRLRLQTPSEEIVLEHRALNRRGFAEGALLASEWLIAKKGIFTFDDVLRDLVAPTTPL